MRSAHSTMTVTLLGAAVALAACGAAPQAATDVDATSVAPADAAAPQQHPDEPEPHARRQHRTATADEAGRESNGTPWHLLPVEDRPVPAEQPTCELAAAIPVVC